MVPLRDSITESFFGFVIFLDISKFIILFCNIEYSPFKIYGRFSEIHKQSIYIKEKWVSTEQGFEWWPLYFFEWIGVENTTLPQDDKKTVFLHETV